MEAKINIKTNYDYEIVYETIEELCKKDKVIPLWILYNKCKAKGLSIYQTRRGIKYLFELGKIRWAGDGYITLC